MVEWVNYLKYTEKKEYLFHDIRWIFIKVKDNTFDKGIIDNISSAFLILGKDSGIMQKYYEIQRNKIMKEAEL